MQNFTIEVENANVEKAMSLFMSNYKEQIALFINNVLKNETGASDAYVDESSGTFKVYQSAPDKGNVLGRYEPEDEVGLVKYSSLNPDSKYVTFDGQKLTLYVKTEDGKPDIKVGNFLSLNDVVTQFDSDSVTTAIDTIKAGIKNAEKEQLKLAKKAAIKELKKAKKN